jgi:hypothetical protein
MGVHDCGPFIFLGQLLRLLVSFTNRRAEESTYSLFETLFFYLGNPFRRDLCVESPKHFT